jgi:C1A family cysteine protease
MRKLSFVKSNNTVSGLMLLTVILTVLMTFSISFAQLTDKDIADLRERGEQEGWTFTVGHNSATQYPLEQITGLVEPPDWRETAVFNPSTPSRDIPESYDWRNETGLPPIRNQGPCGSCWAFGSVGPLECNIRIKDGINVDLSEQWLVSCNESSWDCGGGWFTHDYFLDKGDKCGDPGAVLEEYFPYAASDLPCDCPYPHSYFIESWAFIGGEHDVPSDAAMKQAILDYGPISIACYASYAMQAYDGGVFNGCGSVNGVWIMRNSWGEGWGENGYMRIKYGCDLFGYGANFIVYQPAERIALIDNQIWDDAGGDGDGVPDAGETVQMAFTFENRYVESVTGVTANLFFDDASIKSW